jgi:MFS family permease
MLVIPFVTSFWALLLLALIYGFGFASVTSSTPALISELTLKELVGTSMGFLDTMMDVGQTLGPIISGLILATSLEYVGVFLSLSILLLLACLSFVLSKVPKEK